MTKVLYIQASPRKERSHAVAAADAFVEAYRRKDPAAEVTVVNVFDTALPPFDGPAVSGRYKLGHDLPATPEEKAAWDKVLGVISQFKAADKYVFAVPMWNFGIPYRLKHYVDLVAHPTHTFGYNENGYFGLVTGKPVFVAYSRGGEYPPGTPAENYDFQKRYFELFLGFVGFTNISSVVVEPTLAGGPDVAGEKRQEAMRKAAALADSF
ncbi:FMN-dependent NADH-azoreductase [Desulfovibrio psychrotolerans]|uniref:FMN dependent NADH:quinone oxidoreductase n=1 Tax=Desulfovibrio psychrotolerans TaxID=415242 RepID=A0A7J0BRA1_9BACT|nr:NAD(P)H-dependent oxidoreductase [Desulfovibrio psychrotolerans]GFM36188.1 FMN-dependent NADH-azoreductase [Desulfovibrio psychrotolerans]